MTPSRKFGIYIRSIAHLRASMIYWRIHRAVKAGVIGLLERTRFSTRFFALSSEIPDCVVQPPPSSRLRVERIDPASGTFTFLNDTETLPGERTERLAAIERKPLLWRFHYGYHDYLQDLIESGVAPPRQALEFLDEWMRDHPLGARGARVWAWHPYVLSLRIDSWIRIFPLLEPARQSDGGALNRLSASIEQMTRVLLRNLERGTMANHFLKNIKALILAGLFLHGRVGARAMKKGMKLLERELEEQVLIDGMHFERTPMYHTVMTSDMLDLVEALKAAGRQAPDFLLDAAVRMTEFLGGILHPDGGIPLFNDSVIEFGISPAEVVARGGLLTQGRERSAAGPLQGGRPSDMKSVSGLLQHRTENLFVIFDGGMVGPDYQPGHAHCDSLAYEVSLRGHRLISDTGVYHYRESPERTYCRSTAAHSTVRIDTEDQSEVWKSFRVGRRASSLLCERRIESGITIFHAAHDGYTRIGRSMCHERFMMIGGDEWICVADVLQGEGRHLVENIIHFHPGVTVKREKTGLALASPGGGHARLLSTTEENTRVFDTDFYPAFGSRRSRKTVVFHAHRSFPCISAYSIVFTGTPPELLSGSGARELRYRLQDGREIALQSAL